MVQRSVLTSCYSIKLIPLLHKHISVYVRRYLFERLHVSSHYCVTRYAGCCVQITKIITNYFVNI